MAPSGMGSAPATSASSGFEISGATAAPTANRKNDRRFTVVSFAQTLPSAPHYTEQQKEIPMLPTPKPPTAASTDPKVRSPFTAKRPPQRDISDKTLAEYRNSYGMMTGPMRR